MASPTVAALVAEIDERCAATLAEAGDYFRALDADDNPVTPAILVGIRRGLHCIGVATADPLAVADADVANLSGAAVDHVEDIAEMYALQQALAHWYRALQRYALAPLADQPQQGGWLMDARRATRERVAELKAILAEPYREPSEQTVVTHSRGAWANPWPPASGRYVACWDFYDC